MKKIITLILIVLSLALVTYAYVITQTKTNEQIIKIGNADVSGATLTPLYTSDKVLVPKDVETSSTNEIKYLQFELIVVSDTESNYRLDSELPPEFALSSNSAYTYYTANTTYILTLELNEQVDYSTYTFYLFINFM